MHLVKRLKFEQAQDICPQIKQFANLNSHIYHRLIGEASVEQDMVYHVIDTNGNVTSLDAGSAEALSELPVPVDSQVIGVVNAGVSIFSHTVPYPVFNTTGIYRTRSGATVTIDEIRPSITYSMSGYLPPKLGKKQPIWTIWTKYGEIDSGCTTANDLIEKIG